MYNGRRRWRKWAKGFRYICARSQIESIATGPKLRKRWQRFQSRPPFKPFAVGNLVGASNSTRKWYARVDLLKALYGEETKTWDRRRAKRELVDWSNNLFHSEAIRLYEAARRSNRVGEKLRPCPGCIGCCLWVLREKKPGQFVGRWVPRDEPRGIDPEYDQAIWQILDLMNAGLPMDRRIDLEPVCDDSGTLPAGRPLG